MTATLPYAMPPRPAEQYGTQARVAYEAGQARKAQLLESWHPAAMLWRIHAIGTNVVFDLTWGTSGNFYLEGLLSPLSVSLAGSFSLQARPIDADVGMEAAASLTVGTTGWSVARQRLAVPGDLHPSTGRVTALTSSTLSVLGEPRVLAVGEDAIVAYPSQLVSGTVLAELVL